MKDKSTSEFLEAVLLGSKHKTNNAKELPMCGFRLSTEVHKEPLLIDPRQPGEAWYPLATESKIIFTNFCGEWDQLTSIIMSVDEVDALPTDIKERVSGLRSGVQEVTVIFYDDISPKHYYLCAAALRQTIEIFLAEDAPVFTIYERPNLSAGSSLVASLNKDNGRLLLVSSDESSQAFIKLLKNNISLSIDFKKENLKSFPVSVVTSFN